MTLGALQNSLALKQAHQRLQQIYHLYYIKKEKEFIELIELIKERSLQEIEEAIERLLSISPTSITTEKIKVLCTRGETSLPMPKAKAEDEIIVKAHEILQEYGKLLQNEDTEFSKEVPIL